MRAGMTQLTVAGLQLSFTDDEAADIAATAAAVERAARAGARVVLPPELFQGFYFCRHEHERFFERARPAAKHPAVEAMRDVARAHRIHIPTSFFEAEGPHHYNSLAWVDDRGDVRGVYRKSHIPDGPGYEEKFYFRPGQTGFRVWEVDGATVGVGVCWDQWFPETARAMALMGADVLMYPTAIGSEPQEPGLDTRRLWRRAMVGHAVSNVIPVVACNRVGAEEGQTFYGTSFIADERGDIVSELDDREQGLVLATLDLAAARAHRHAFGFFRDRRPELYSELTRSV
jgi:N-carbamoylputrescine amidase